MDKIVFFVKKNLLLTLFFCAALIITFILFFNDVENPKPEIESIFPSPNTITTTLDSNIPILICFKQPVLKNTFTTSVYPKIKIFSSPQENSEKCFILRPFPGWEFDTKYQITIDKTLSSLKKKTLSSPVVFYFQITRPEKEDSLYNIEVAPPPHLRKKD